MTTQELDKAIADARQGREEGYRRLFAEYGGDVFRLVSRMVADAGEAEELTQDTFLKAFGALGGYRQQGAGFGAWIRRIAYRTALSALRRADRATVAAESLDNLDAAEEVQDAAEERSEALEAAIAALPKEEQTLLHLFYYDSMPMREIAYVTSSNVPLVATRLSRIRKKLRRQLEHA